MEDEAEVSANVFVKWMYETVFFSIVEILS